MTAQQDRRELRTIPDDLSCWHWLTSPMRVFRLTNGDYTTKAYGQPNQACDEARAYLRRPVPTVQASFLVDQEACV